jgi:hypothetical protein
MKILTSALPASLHQAAIRRLPQFYANWANWLNGIEAQPTALRSFAVDGTAHECHQVQAARMIALHRP